MRKRVILRGVLLMVARSGFYVPLKPVDHLIRF